MNKQFSINYFIIIIFSIAPLIGFVTVTFFDMAFYNVVSVLIFVAFLYTLLLKSRGQSNFRFPDYAIFYLLFTIYTIISDIFIVEKDITLNYLVKNRLLSGFFIIIIIENTFFSEKVIKNISLLIKIMVVIAFFVIVIQQTIDSSFLVLDTYYEDKMQQGIFFDIRMPSIYTWTDPLDVGMGALPLLALIVSFQLKQNKKYYWTWVIIGIIYSFITQTRWIMLSMIIVLIMIPVYKKINLQNLIKYLILSLFLIIISLQGLKLIGINIRSIIDYRILESDKTDIRKTSAGSRILAFKVFGKLYPKNPIFGVGSRKYGIGGTGKHDKNLQRELRGRSSQIHIGYLSVFYYFGFFGGIFFLLFLWYMMKRIYVAARLRDAWGPFFGMLILVIANLTLVDYGIFNIGPIICLVFYRYYTQSFDAVPQSVIKKLSAKNIKYAC